MLPTHPNPLVNTRIVRAFSLQNLFQLAAGMAIATDYVLSRYTRLNNNIKP